MSPRESEYRNVHSHTRRESSRPSRNRRLVRQVLSGMFLFILSVLPHLSSSTESDTPLFILFSGSGNGILRSCYCPNAPWGGPAKRAWLVSHIREQVGTNNVVLLDSGDLFPSEPEPERALCMMRLYSGMDYDAVAVGDQELTPAPSSWLSINDAFRYAGDGSAERRPPQPVLRACGGRDSVEPQLDGEPSAFTQKFRRGTLSSQSDRTVHEEAPSPDASRGFPWLSGGYTTTVNTQGKDFPAKPWIVVNRAGLRIGVVSVVDKAVFRFAPPERLEGLRVTDPRKVIHDFKSANTNLDLVIVLSHQGDDADRALASDIEGVDLIVGGHSQTLIVPPDVVNGVAIVQAGKNAENLGVLAISRNTGPAGNAGSVKDEAPQYRGTNEYPNPFAVSVATTPRWRFVQQIIPLDTKVDEDESAARLVDDYYAGQDEALVQALTNPPPADPAEPRLLVKNPVQDTVIRPGETQRFSVALQNIGEAPLAISAMRSKIRWLKVADYPTNVTPGQVAEAHVELHANDIDRHFRSEFTMTTSDKKRIVIRGTVNGHVEGDIPGILDVSGLMDDMRRLSAAEKDERAVGGRAERLTGTFAFHSPNPTQLEGETPSSRIRPNQPYGSAERRHPQPESHPIGGRDSVFEPPPLSTAVTVEFFYAAGCDDCQEIKTRILPVLKEQFGELVSVKQCDIREPSVYLRLATLQKKLGVRTSENVSIYLDSEVHLGGIEAIRKNLITGVDSILAGKGDYTPAASNPLITESATPPTAAWGILSERLRSYGIWTIAVFGLFDGLNPCAFSTIVFFITLLATARVSGKRLLLVGFGYCLATFVTYLLLGFGALQVVLRLSVYEVFSNGLKWLMVAVLGVFAALSFRDAWVYSRTGSAKSVLLQLPDRIKLRIHGIMRTRLSVGGLLVGSLTIGFLVTLLESVCTGQVYGPTLVFMTRHPELRLKAWALLVLYNLMFIVPLVVVILASFFGARSPRLLDWSRRNVILIKTLLGCLFLALLVGMLAF